MHPYRVAAGARIAKQVVVAAAAADLDRIARHLEATGAVEVGGAARIDARVAVPVSVAICDQAMVGGEGEEAVLGVPAADHVVDDEAVGLEDVDRVERGSLGGEVTQVEAVRAIAANDVQLLKLRVEDHVGG